MQRPSKTVQDRPRLSKTLQDRPRLSKTLQDSPRPYKTIQDCPRTSKIVQDRPRLFKTVQDLPRLSKIVQNHPRPYKNFQEYPRLFMMQMKLILTIVIFSNSCNYILLPGLCSYIEDKWKDRKNLKRTTFHCCFCHQKGSKQRLKSFY